MRNSFRLFFVISLCLHSLFSNAQGDTLEIQRDEKGKISFAHFKPNDNRKINNGVTFLKAILSAKRDDEFRLLGENTDTLGMSHRRYQQYYKGIKVENAEYLIHGKNGNIETINGDFHDVSIFSVMPSVKEQRALIMALNFVHAQKYKWEDSNMEKFIKQNTKDSNATYYPKGELVITKDLLKGSNNFKLAWKFSISSLLPNNEQLIYVNAATGDVIRMTPMIDDVNTPCNGQTRYSGTLPITGDSFVGGFRLREDRNNVNVQTLNLQGTFNYANAVDFANANTNFTAGNWPNFNQDRAALDAHWGAESVLDYWRVVHNRNSIDGNGIQVIGYVHYFEPNSPAGWPNNAQWDRTNHVMRYGDGDGFLFNPLTTLDICGHEMGHGITQFTANLTPGTQESGALNEGFSDIWAACIENRSAPNKQTWLMGEELSPTGVFTCIRNLQNPKSTTTAEGQHPDTYHGNFWDNNGEPHNNSTVLSHWFYLLSQGGNGTNDIGSAYNVAGIGINIARLIAYRTESVYLNATANYAAARTGSIQAARDLYGTGSCQEISTTNAWFAVGVGTAYVGNAGLSISGDITFCTTTSNNYTIPNLPAGATVVWQTTPAGIATPNTPTATQTTLMKSSNGAITLTANISNVCTGIPILVPKTVNVGTVIPISYIDEEKVNNGCVTETSTYTVIGGNNATNYKWYYRRTPSGSFSLRKDGPDNFYTFTQSNRGTSCINYEIKVEASNICSPTPVAKTLATSVCPCDGLQSNVYSVSPNPANNTITISSSNKESTNVADNTFDAIRIYDLYGNLKLFKKYSNVEMATIDISSLQNGSYFIEIANSTNQERQQLIIQK